MENNPFWTKENFHFEKWRKNRA